MTKYINSEIMTRRSFDKDGNRISYPKGSHVDYVGPDGRVVRIAHGENGRRYFIHTSNGVSKQNHVMEKDFANSRNAALAAWKAGGSVFCLAK